MPDLALPVVIVRYKAGASRALVRNAAPLLARSVDLQAVKMQIESPALLW